MQGELLRRALPAPLRRAFGVVRELALWWWGEMRDIGGQLLRLLPSRKSPQVFVRVGDTAMSVECREAHEWKVVGTVPRSADGSWPAEIPGLPKEWIGARAVLLVPESELFFCEFELPTATERQLGAVLQLQLERALPLPLAQLLYDRQIIRRDRERLTVRVAVAHRETVEQLRDAVARWPLSLIGAGVVNEQGAPLFNFFRKRRDPLRWRPTQQDLWLLRSAAAGVGVMALVLGCLWLRERYVVNDGSAELRSQAAKLSAERETLVVTAKPLQAMQDIAGTRDAPAVLAALSSAMPQGAWFTHIDIVAHVESPGVLKLTGPVISREEALKALGGIPGVRNLKASSAFNGEIVGPETVEFTADFDAAQPKAEKL